MDIEILCSINLLKLHFLSLLLRIQQYLVERSLYPTSPIPSHMYLFTIDVASLEKSVRIDRVLLTKYVMYRQPCANLYQTGSET